MSTKQNDIYFEYMIQELEKAMINGDKEREERIREELSDGGILSPRELEELEQYRQ